MILIQHTSTELYGEYETKLDVAQIHFFDKYATSSATWVAECTGYWDHASQNGVFTCIELLLYCELCKGSLSCRKGKIQNPFTGILEMRFDFLFRA